MHKDTYSGTPLEFSAEKPFDEAKVMVWETLDTLVSVCRPEDVKL